MRTDMFMVETQGVSKTLGRKEQLQVVFQGNEAHTQGNVVVLPALPSEAEISDQHARIMRGFVDHEALHLRHTDFKTLSKMRDEGVPGIPAKGTKGEERLKIWANAIEDMRIERLGLAEYPGMRHNIEATANAVNTAAKDGVIADTEKTWSRYGPFAITWAGRIANGIATETCKEMLDILPEDMRKKVESIESIVSGVSSTRESVEAALAILKKMDEESPPEEDMNLPAGAGEGEGEDDERKVHDMPIEPSLERAVDDVGAQFDYAGKTGQYRVLTTKFDKWHNRHSNNSYGFGMRNGAAQYKRQVDSSVGAISVMRRKLERLVQARMNVDWEVGRMAGRLDSKRLVAAYSGSPLVYKTRMEAPTLDTAVAILVDLSGSMSGGKAMLAERIVIAMTMALDTIKVPVAVYGFCNTFEEDTGDPSGKSLSKKEKNEWHKLLGTISAADYGRVEPLNMLEFKGFDDRLRDARSSLGAISKCVGGNNSDGDALLMTWGKLRQRREKRRIILALSDGQPACAGNGTCVSHLKQVTTMLSKSDVELYGIGIISDAVKKFYPKYTVTQSLDHFATGSMDALAQLLLGHRARVSVVA